MQHQHFIEIHLKIAELLIWMLSYCLCEVYKTLMATYLFRFSLYLYKFHLIIFDLVATWKSSAALEHMRHWGITILAAPSAEVHGAWMIVPCSTPPTFAWRLIRISMCILFASMQPSSRSTWSKPDTRTLWLAETYRCSFNKTGPNRSSNVLCDDAS